MLHLMTTATGLGFEYEKARGSHDRSVTRAMQAVYSLLSYAEIAIKSNTEAGLKLLS